MNITLSPSSKYSILIDFDLWIDALSKINNTLSCGSFIFFNTDFWGFELTAENVRVDWTIYSSRKCVPFGCNCGNHWHRAWNQMLLIVSFSQLRIHEYSFFINLEKDVLSIFMRHSEVLSAVYSWIQNIDFMHSCFFGSYLASLDFPFLYGKQSISLKYFLTKWMETCIPVLFPEIHAGIICCFSIRMLLSIMSKCILDGFWMQKSLFGLSSL